MAASQGCALKHVPAKWNPVRNGEPLFADKDMRQALPLLGERAALLPGSRIENRAVDFAGCVSDEGDPRVIAALDLEFIL